MKTFTTAVAFVAAALLTGCAGMNVGSGNDPSAFRSAVGACQIPAARAGSDDVLRDCLRHRGWNIERRVGFTSAAMARWPIEVRERGKAEDSRG